MLGMSAALGAREAFAEGLDGRMLRCKQLLEPSPAEKGEQPIMPSTGTETCQPRRDTKPQPPPPHLFPLFPDSLV